MFAIQRIEGQGYVLLALSGELDVKAADELLAAARREFGRFTGSKVLVIDLRPLTFLDSAGLGALWTLRGETVAREVELRLIRGRAEVQRVFELTGLDSSFAFRDEAAV